MSISPITDAVYGRKKRQAPKPAAPRKERPAPSSTVASALGTTQVSGLYRALGFRSPDQRRRKGRS